MQPFDLDSLQQILYRRTTSIPFGLERFQFLIREGRCPENVLQSIKDMLQIDTLDLDSIKEILTRSTSKPFAFARIQYLLRKETAGRRRENVLQLLTNHAKNMLLEPKVSACVYLCFISEGRNSSYAHIHACTCAYRQGLDR